MEQAKCIGDENMVRRQELIHGNLPAALKTIFETKVNTKSWFCMEFAANRQ